MKISTQLTRERLTELWPDLEYIWLWDTEFWIGKETEFDKLMANSRLNSTTFIDNFWDCDDYAQQFLAEVKRKRYLAAQEGTLPLEQQISYAMFYVGGDMFRGMEKLHAANLVILEEGIFLADLTPSERRKWKVDPKQDNIYFIAS